MGIYSMSLIERSIHRPVAVTVCVALVLIFGGLALFRVPVQLTPNVDQPVISITTRWFGADPQEIEQEIIREQEDVLKTVSGLREMIATCSEGEGKVELKFFVGVDKEAALNEVRDKLRQVPEYPEEVDEPVVESVDSSADNFIAWSLLRASGGDPAATRPALARANDPSVVRGHDYVGDVTELQTFAEENIKTILERVEGIAEVNVLGGREREMQVKVDLQKLASRGISMDRFVAALRNENRDVTAGTIAEGKRDLSVRVTARYDHPQEILETVVAYEPDGAPVYVKDVADAGVGFKKQVSFVRSLGQDVVAINVKRETGSNVLRVMAGLKAQIEKVNTQVLADKPWGLELFQVYDETVYVDQSVDTASKDLLLGAVLSAIVLFLTLRSVGATAVVTLAMPISIVGTFLGMYLAGRNLNVISLAGMAFAIGMGIDNTIVVLENIFRHREMGKDRYTAALDGTREVWGAIVAATLANIAVFLPMAFIEEEAGQLFRDISIAISISLFLYMVVSPTVIPMLATLFLRRMPAGLKEGEERATDANADRGNGHANGDGVHAEGANGDAGDASPVGRPAAAAGGRNQTRLGRLTRPIQRAQSLLSGKFFDIVMWMTRGVARRLVLVTAMIVIAIAGSYWLMPARTYLPSGNQNLVFAMLIPPPGYSIDEFRRMGYGVEAHLRPWWEAKPGSPELAALQRQWEQQTQQMVIPMLEQTLAGMQQAMPPEAFAAASAPMRQQLDRLKRLPPPSGLDQYFFVAFGGIVFMGGSSNDPQNVAPLVELFNRSVQGVPGTFGFASQMPIFQTGRVGGASIDVNVTGNDYDTVRAAAGMLQGTLMQAFNSFVQPEPGNFAIGRTEIRVEPSRERAAAAGVSVPAIRDIGQVAVDGLVIGDYRDRGDNIDLTVMSSDRFGRTSDQLGNVPVVTRTGNITPLRNVADLIDSSAPTQIRRLERDRAVTLSVPLPPGMTVDEAQGIVDRKVNELRQAGMIGGDIDTIMTGSSDKLTQFFSNFVWLFVLAAVITYLLLAALFESFLHPFVIIMSVPFALVGGFLGLRILHTFQPDILLDVLTMLGFVILIGTIVNNPILIVHQALNYIRDERMDRRRAIALSTQTRVRPIFMSVITSVAGMAPLVVLGGAGSELYRGLGAVVIGGLLVSTVFTLFLTPALMSLMMDAQEGMQRLFRPRPSRLEAEPYGDPDPEVSPPVPAPVSEAQG